MTRSELLDFLARMGACDDAIFWVRVKSFEALPPQPETGHTVAQLWDVCPEPGWMLWLWTALDPQCHPRYRDEHGLPIPRPGCGEIKWPVLLDVPWEMTVEWPAQNLPRALANWLVENGHYSDFYDAEEDEEEAWDILIDYAPVFCASIRQAIPGELIEQQIRTFDARKRELDEE